MYPKYEPTMGRGKVDISVHFLSLDIDTWGDQGLPGVSRMCLKLNIIYDTKIVTFSTFSKSIKRTKQTKSKQNQQGFLLSICLRVLVQTHNRRSWEAPRGGFLIEYGEMVATSR